MTITFPQIVAFIQEAFAGFIALLSINTGGTCGSHLALMLLAIVVWGNRSGARVRRNYTSFKVRARGLVKR